MLIFLLRDSCREAVQRLGFALKTALAVCHGVPENGQGHVLLPGTVFPHPDPKSGTKEKLPGGHQVTLLRRFKLQHSAVPDEGMELTAGDPDRQE